MSISDEIDCSAAIQRGAAFLADAQQEDGGFLNLFWYGDAAPVSVANVFPAALIAHSLSFVPEAAAVRERALNFLAAEATPEGVWNHWSSSARGEFLPPDVDDTACASAALRDGGRPVPKNERLFFANRDRRGLFYTWFTWRPRWNGLAHFRLVWPQHRHIRTLVPLFTTTLASIHNVDAVVNANALFYLGVREETAAIPPYLVDILENDREMECDTWYVSPFVVWYFFARAFGSWHAEARELMRKKLCSTAPQSALDVATAQCARFYLQMPGDDSLAERLLESQLESGGWPAEKFYRGKDCYWGSEAVTSGFALEALSRGALRETAVSWLLQMHIEERTHRT